MIHGLSSTDLSRFLMTAWPHVHDVGSVRFSIGTSLTRILSWKPNPVPDEQCFEAIKAGINGLPPGAKMFLNGGKWANVRSANPLLDDCFCRRVLRPQLIHR